MEKNWNIRLGLPSDLEFIYATWLNSYWADSQKYQQITGPTFFTEYPKVLDRILDSPETQVSVACSSSDENIIYGYLVSSPPVAHYLFVKSNFRRWGIARSLLEDAEAGKIYTHRTGELANFLHRRINEHTYNPYLLFNRGEKQNGTV